MQNKPYPIVFLLMMLWENFNSVRIHLENLGSLRFRASIKYHRPISLRKLLSLLTPWLFHQACLRLNKKDCGKHWNIKENHQKCLAIIAAKWKRFTNVRVHRNHYVSFLVHYWIKMSDLAQPSLCKVQRETLRARGAFWNKIVLLLPSEHVFNNRGFLVIMLSCKSSRPRVRRLELTFYLFSILSKKVKE